MLTVCQTSADPTVHVPMSSSGNFPTFNIMTKNECFVLLNVPILTLSVFKIVLWKTEWTILMTLHSLRHAIMISWFQLKCVHYKSTLLHAHFSQLLSTVVISCLSSLSILPSYSREGRKSFITPVIFRSRIFH